MRLPVSKRAAAAGIMAIGLATIFAQDALAQRRDFHGRDFRRFTREERRIWFGGRWIHDYHAGRLGWWWVVDGGWYFYPRPIYPYPTYVEPEFFVDDSPPPPGPPPPPEAFGSPPLGPPPAPSWYYCDNPQGYYPYVMNCNGAWREVPAIPPGVQPSPPPR
jgi:hypothetical protein